MKFEIYNLKWQKGVTLIELVVVLALFMAIVGVTVSIFITVVNQQRTILREQTVLNQASFLTDYLSRTIRMSIKDTAGTCLSDEQGTHPGYIYLLTHSKDGFYEGLKLLANNGVCQEIYLDEDGNLQEIKDGSQPQEILAGSLVIPYARFVINGDKSIKTATGIDAIQPRVTFMINIQTQDHGITKDHIIQSTVSQINLNL